MEKENLKVFACKGFSLGLHCFHVLIIGISEAENILPLNKIRDKNLDNPYSDLSALSKEEAEKLANHAAILFENGSDTLEKILDIDKYVVYTGCITSIKGISAALFISMLYIKAENWNCAVTYLTKYMDELSLLSTVKREDFEYYCTIKIILEMKSNNWTDEQIRRSLNYVSDVKMLLDMVTLQDTLFTNIPQLSPTGLLQESDSLMNAVEFEKTILEKLLGRDSNAKRIE